MVPPNAGPAEPADNSHGQPSGPPRVRRWRWRLALGFVLLGAVAALIAVYVTRSPDKYTARVLLNVQATPPRLLFQTTERQTDYDTYRRTQATLIKSRLVLNTALRNPKVAELAVIKTQFDPVEWLEKRVGVDFVGDSEVMRISVSGDNEQDLVTLVDAITEAYLTEIVNKEQIERLRRLDQLKDVLTRQERGLREKRKMLRNLAENAGTPERSAPAEQALLQKLTDCQRELRRVQLAQVGSQAKLARLQGTQPATEGRRRAVGELEDELAALAAQEKLLRSEEERLTAQISDREKKLNMAFMDLESYKEEIAEMEAVNKRIRSEIAVMEVELKAAPRISLLDSARLLTGKEVALTRSNSN
jgi:hypothetical protein